MASTMTRSGGIQPPQGDAQRMQDLQQLQREYRHMELNRRAYAEESQQLLRKQQVSLPTTRRENMLMTVHAYDHTSDRPALPRSSLQC